MKNLVGSHSGAAGMGLPMEEVMSRQRSRIHEAFAAFSEGGHARDKVLDLGALGYSQAADRLQVKGRQGVDHQVSFHDALLPADRERHAGRFAKDQDTSIVLELPFADGEFDWVFCNRVLEFAGDTVQQFMVLKEMTRIARRGVFVTASNRRHPIEFNTGLPLLHWLPNSYWRRSLALTGKKEMADLPSNLLNAGDLAKMASMLSGGGSFDIGHIRYLGIKAQFFLMLRKE